MENFRAITMGIEEYCHWQPLKGAENNAQALYCYFFQEAKLPSRQLLLLTDTSPSPGKRSTYPNRENILQWINDSPLKVKHCWFFFQGYGVNYQGEDYLLPIDSNPQTIPQTGIKMRSLFEKLKASSEQLLVILDLQNPFKDGKLGQITLELAQEKDISLIFSCRSHVYQTISAEKGIFMTALIEALRYYGHHLTLTKLDAYLQERLNPIHRANFPTIALPIIISPSLTASRQPLLPQPKPQAKNQPQPLTVTLQQNLSQTSINQPITTLNLPILPKLPAQTQFKFSLPRQQSKGKTTQVDNPQIVSSTVKKQAIFTKIKLFHQWLLWGGGILLFMGLIWLIQGKIRQQLDLASEEKTEKNQLILDYAKIPLSLYQASRLNESIQFARQIKPNTPLYGEARQNIARWSQGILDIAQGRATQGDFIGAIAAAQLVPNQDQTLYLSAQQSIKRWQTLSQQQEDNQVLIEAALALVKPNQASSYNRAITTLGYLKMGEPGYNKAQQLIEQLSQQIYQLAQTRATQGQLNLALKTAQLVPQDSQVYKKAQQSMKQWQQQLPPR
ncbi:caspase family protein [Crocosphaera sp. XPORK-15E]|uniref:caspase family protein n=1 Tax=Crocosphaera sp. XPORK-15E TaxID=3110247 RepID=UPI002B1EB646|nr:caspase family protein [Crocosphaera sp. XPORK-15E]MEA5534993.1 caspase family protein [Crocosphaera sp. XPORK-15E]